MRPNPEFDKPGYCALCHDQIVEFDGVNKVKRLLGKARMTQFMMDNGVIVLIAICEKCKETMTAEQTTELMDSVIKGWEFECETLMPDTPDDVKKEYLENCNKRYLVERTDEKKWTRETIVEAVWKEAIEQGNKDAEAKGISWL